MTGDSKFTGKVTQTLTTRLTGWITIGAAGAITAQAGTASQAGGIQQCGITWTRQAAGDYRATLHRGYKRLIRADGSVTMPAVATAPTLAAGNMAFIQGVLATYFPGTAAVPITGLGLTTTRTDTQVLADPTSGVTLTYDIELADQ